MEGNATIWFIVGVALIVSEFFLPGIVLVFFGISAILVAILEWCGLVTELSTQLWVFSVGSLVLLFALRRFFKQWFVGKVKDDADAGEIDLDEFVGKEVKVVEAIAGEGTRGKGELKGADWKASSLDALEVGAIAEVVERDGLTLVVKRL